MRIALVYDAIYPYVSGGAERRYFELGGRLARRGHDVHFVGWQYWPGAATRFENGCWLHGAGAPPPLHDAGGRRTFREAWAFAWRSAAVLARLDVDVIECSSIPYASTFTSRLVAAMKRRPLFVSWHEYMGQRWDTYAPGRASLARFVERQSARLGARRLAVSRFTEGRLPAGPETCVVENGVDCDALALTPAARSAPDVVVAGRLVPHKRLELLLDALALTPHVTAGLVGDGPHRAALERHAAALGVAARVTFYGRVEPAEAVYGLFKAARCVAVTSEQEGFAITVVEAQAAGTPPVVVRSPHSAAAELVRDGVDGLVSDPTPDALAVALTRIIADPDLRDRLAANARVSARRYDWDALVDRIEQAYTSLLRTSPAGIERERADART
jgi:glycosyltransferase involved in cell wall biosynthesis